MLLLPSLPHIYTLFLGIIWDFKNKAPGICASSIMMETPNRTLPQMKWTFIDLDKMKIKKNNKMSTWRCWKVIKSRQILEKSQNLEKGMGEFSGFMNFAHTGCSCNMIRDS